MQTGEKRNLQYQHNYQRQFHGCMCMNFSTKSTIIEATYPLNRINKIDKHSTKWTLKNTFPSDSHFGRSLWNRSLSLLCIPCSRIFILLQYGARQMSANCSIGVLLFFVIFIIRKMKMHSWWQCLKHCHIRDENACVRLTWPWAVPCTVNVFEWPNKLRPS